MIKLYDFPISGHSHRVRALLSILGLDYEIVHIDLKAGEQKSEEFLTLNPMGQIPVLIDGDRVLRDSNAILCYLARQYGPEWYPEDPESVGDVQTWLATSTKDVTGGPGAARLVTLFGADLDHEKVIAQSHQLLKVMDGHLAERSWLATDKATIADIACYTYIAHAPEGGVSLDNYPNINAWLARVEALPGFVTMPATEVVHAA